jgi:hypothetical protein
MSLCRKLALLLAVASALLLLQGCWVTFVYPIGDYSKEAVVDPSLDGNWYQPESNCNLVIGASSVGQRNDPQGMIRRTQPPMYTLEYSAPKDNDQCLVDPGHHVRLSGFLMQIGKNRFLDLQPNPEATPSEPARVFASKDYDGLYLKLHSVLKVVKNEDGSILLIPPSYQWFDQQQKAKTLPLDAISDSPVVTSHSDKVREFLIANADNPKVFTSMIDGKTVWRFVRQK